MGFASGTGGPSRDLIVKRSTPPNSTGRVYGVVYSGLDIGATVEAGPDLLAQFALAGTAYARVRLGLPEPRVGLLSVGAEDGKGDELLYQMGALDQSLSFAELKRRARINQRALDTSDASDFSNQIRVGIPGY